MHAFSVACCMHSRLRVITRWFPIEILCPRTTHRYVRQLAQEQREKEVLYKIRNVKVPPVDRMQKPLPAFTALERCLAKPQYVPSVRCSKLLAELGEQIKVC